MATIKVRLFRVYSLEHSYNYGDDWQTVPMSIGVTDWEELEESKFGELKQALDYFNANAKDYRLIIVREHEISVHNTIAAHLKYMEEQQRKWEKQQAEDKKKREEKKRIALEKKLNKQKLAKQALLEQLQRELQES
jgi:hypothetical protein